MYELSSAFPVPEGYSKKGQSIYPFRTMPVGQSFAVPLAKDAAASAAMYKVQSDTGATFTKARRNEGGADVARFWRIS